MKHHRCEHTHITLAELQECLEEQNRAYENQKFLAGFVLAMVLLAIGYLVWP